MRYPLGVLALAVAASLCASTHPAQAAFSDQICPEATQYVVALGQLQPAPPLGNAPAGDSAQKVYDVARAATSAYDTCSKRHLSNGNAEPGVHYAYTREASFGILEARALLALNRPGDAKAVAQNSKRLAQEVFDWRRSIAQSGGIISSSGSDNRPSIYRDAAKDIVAAADDMLAKLAAPAANASPAAAPAPSPHR
jgi:acyl-homoserine lactone acylase PvdQ